MSPQTREILVNLSMALAESEHLIFVAECESCEMDKDIECGTGVCGIWLVLDAMSYARGAVLDELEGVQDA